MKKFILTLFFCLNFINICNASPSYTAEINVDVTDTNVTNAKKIALTKATRDALNDVVLSISTEQAVEEISKLNDNQIQHFIKELQILMEKSSDVRYIADLKIEIKEDVLKAYLQENNFPIVINQPKDILLIPLFVKNDNTTNLWTDENLLRQELLNKTNLKSNVVNFHLIEKNLGNITAITTQTIFDMNERKYNELSHFNKVDNIAVIKYSLPDKKVYVKMFPSKNTFEENITLRDNISTMIDKIFTQIKDNSKTPPTTNTATPDKIVVNMIYSYPALSTWTKLKQSLETNPLIENIIIVSMANKKVHFNFSYSGPVENLQSDLTKEGYTLENKGEYYAIN